MTTLLVARHGETDWNRERRWVGQADRDLTDLGREQARGLGRALAGTPLAAAYSSDLRRARETARIALEGRGLVATPVRALRERFLGSWEGLLESDVPLLFPELYARWKASAGPGAPDAEPFASIVERVLAAARAIAAAHEGSTVLVVAHSGPLRVLQAEAARLDFVQARLAMKEPAHCEIVRYEVTRGVIRPSA